jgi:glycosyltransferase involved in cell wall biosynthesis
VNCRSEQSEESSTLKENVGLNKMITVVIPAYNEDIIIEDNIYIVKQYLESLPDNYQWELILVDDGSKDNTGIIMERLSSANSNIRVYHHKTNCGIGMALKTGFKEALGDIIVTLDADLSYSTEHIYKLLQKMEETNADIVSASCYARGGKVENVPFNRAIVSKIGNQLLSYAMGGNITVATCIVMAYKADVIKSMDLTSDDKDLTPEILYKAITLGLRIEEVPATLKWSDRKLNREKVRKRKSKFKLKRNVITHFFILLWSRPFMLFLTFGLVMFIVGFFELGLLVYRFIVDMNTRILDQSFNQSLILSARYIISKYTPSLILTGVMLILGIQFISLGFIAIQAQRNFKELYHLIYTSIRNKKI